MGWTKRAAKNYYDRNGSWPKGYEPPEQPKTPETVRTEGERALFRIQTGKRTPEEQRSPLGKIPYDSLPDSMTVHKEFGLFPHLAKQSKPKSLADSLKAENTLAREQALNNLLTGKPLSRADSLLVKNHLPKPEKPNPSAEETDWLAEIRMRVARGEALPGDEEVIKRYSKVKKDLSPSSAKQESTGVTKSDYNSAQTSLRTVMGKITDMRKYMKDSELTPTENNFLGLLNRQAEEYGNIIDSYDFQELIRKNPSVPAGRTAISDVTGKRYRYDGERWREIKQ